MAKIPPSMPPNKPPRGPQEGGGDKVGGPDKAQQKPGQDFAGKVGGGQPSQAQNVQGAQQAAKIQQPNMEKLRNQIQDGIKNNNTKEQIRHDVVETQLQDQFGHRASPQMVEAVTKAVKNNPALSNLFNELYKQATQGLQQ